MKRFFSLLLVLVCLFAVPASAQNTSFRDDYLAMNRAAGSVLMLLVYNRDQNTYITTGSGFVAFDSSTLITNYHVVEGGDLILAESDEGNSYFLDRVLVADKNRDIAILRFKNATPLAPLSLDVKSQRLRGQPVVAIGSPEGYKNTLSKGDISALFSEEGVAYLQFTAPISSGSSGGALFNNQGQVIGITTGSLTGESQNLNFAIDIREAVALYESANPAWERPLSQLEGMVPKKAAEEEQTGPKPAAENPISGFTAKEIQPGQVRLSWQSTLPSGQTYHISYEIDGNPYYSFVTARQTEALIDDLVPGKLYHFGVALSQETIETPLAGQSLRLKAAEPCQMRGLKVLSTAVYLVPEDTEFKVPLMPMPPSIDRARMEQAGSGGPYDFKAVYRLRLAEDKYISAGDCLYVLTTPLGSVYSDDYLYSYEATAGSYLRSADLEDLIDEVMEMEEQIPLGEWQLSVYHDGAFIGLVSFQVSDEAAAAEAPPPEEPEEPEAPTNLQVGFSERGVHFTWREMPGADSYHVYRSTGEEGMAFFLETVSEPEYLDTKAVKGRTYVYQVEAVCGEQTSPRSSLLLVFGGEVQEQQDEETSMRQLPGYPLDFGEEAYVGNLLNPFINPDVINLSQDKTVTGFTLAFYCENEDFEALTFGDSGETISYYTYDVRIPPGEMVNPGEVNLRQYGLETHYIYLAIAKVVLEDGEIIEIPPEKLDFYFWILNDLF